MSNDGGADHLQPGTRLPPFALLATDGRQVDLAALAGKTMLIVYPWTGRPRQPNPPDWDAIPGARTESCVEGCPDFANRYFLADIARK